MVETKDAFLQKAAKTYAEKLWNGSIEIEASLWGENNIGKILFKGEREGLTVYTSSLGTNDLEECINAGISKLECIFLDLSSTTLHTKKELEPLLSRQIMLREDFEMTEGGKSLHWTDRDILVKIIIDKAADAEDAVKRIHEIDFNSIDLKKMGKKPGGQNER